MSDLPEQPVQPSNGVDQSHLPYPYQRLTRGGELLAVNEAWSTLLGYEAAAVTGDQFEEYVLQPDRADFRAAYEQSITGERSAPIELDLRHAAGHPVTVTFDVRIERDDGAFVQAHCHFTAIDSSGGLGSVGTTEGRADDQFSATEERMQLAVEGAKLGIWDWDMQADEVLRDELLANMLGYSPEEMGDQLDDWERLVHPDGKQRHDEALAEHVANETDFYQCDYRMQTRSGDYKWVRTMGTVVAWDEDGAPLRAVGIHLDIDEQKRNQLKLARRTEQLEALNRVVRHDIRNDMNALYGWAQELDGHVDASGVEALEQVLTSAHHILELTEVAREFVESLGVAEDVDLEPVNLREHLRNELAKQRDAHPDADFEVVGDLPNATVRANEMLSSVFRNVLVNAVEHNDAATPTVTVTVAAGDQTVEVRIADNGPGISDALKDEIFNKGTKSLSDGAGLGLYIVETLVDSYGGTVSIEDREKLRPTRSRPQAENTDSTGSVFIIELPLIDSEG
ncbi:Signal transduction histidine kinase [Halapricum desulfuricans]|uniref:histidine kinase n=1 Tax=Halapricum desulfuricans TaxID=2841257 RepID=A0A897NPE9_9EURY|nr:PAS domain-containing sensor histidine kinase [Halapricum desulfuricans]QSG13345.1 Signal transduction histidine kinase [Halapricum desulfuricans]